MKLSRRLVLKLAAAGGLAATAFGAIRAFSDTRPAYIRAVVRAQLPYLNIPNDVLDEFAADFVRLVPAMSTRGGRMVAFLGPGIGGMLAGFAGGERAWRYDAFEERIASSFLLATDFFDMGADVSQSLSYVTFPDPYEGPCRNPLATLSF